MLKKLEEYKMPLLLASIAVILLWYSPKDNLGANQEEQGILSYANTPPLYIQRVQVEGYHPGMLLEVAIHMEKQEVAYVKVVEHHETEGYGNYITESWFLDKFKGVSIEKPFELVPLVANNPHELVAITGATISTEAVMEGVNLAVATYIKKKGKR